MACGILVPQPGIKLVPLATKLQKSNHWTPGNSTYTIIFFLSQAQKAINCIILFIWNMQNRQIYRDRKQISGWQEAGGGRNRN